MIKETELIKLAQLGNRCFYSCESILFEKTILVINEWLHSRCTHNFLNRFSRTWELAI